MDSCICDFLYNRRTICSNKANLDIPYYTILRVFDKKRETECLFTVEYCPVCGCSVMKEKKNKDRIKCNLCIHEKSIFTDSGSPHRGEMQIDKPHNRLIIKTEKNVTYSYSITFCPLCGKNVDEQ